MIQHEPDYNGDPERNDPEDPGPDEYFVQHPNLMCFMQHEQWVCSDADLDRAIALIQKVKEARQNHEQQA